MSRQTDGWIDRQYIRETATMKGVIILDSDDAERTKTAQEYCHDAPRLEAAREYCNRRDLGQLGVMMRLGLLNAFLAGAKWEEEQK